MRSRTLLSCATPGRRYSAPAICMTLMAALSVVAPSYPAGSVKADGSAVQLLGYQVGVALEKPAGFTPSFIRSHYGFNELTKDAKGQPITGTGQTIAIIAFGGDPYVKQSLEGFIEQYGLQPMKGLAGTRCDEPSPYAAQPCFMVDDVGIAPPATDDDMEEMDLDVEWAHVAAPGANIRLIVPDDGTTAAILSAVHDANDSGASVVSMSWDGLKLAPDDLADFGWPNVAYVSGEGDVGYPEVHYPAAYPTVLSVGGTNIAATGEDSWEESGGGQQTQYARPDYQDDWTTDLYRDVNDVAYAARGTTPAGRTIGYSVYNVYSKKSTKWSEQGGVSAGIPQWAGIIADADQLRESHGKSVLAGEGVMDGLYLAAGTNQVSSGVINKAYFTDITNGCSSKLEISCAVPGYDYVTGLGVPVVNDLVFYLGYDV